MRVRPYSDLRSLFRDYAPSAAFALERMVAEMPEKGGVVVRHKTLKQPDRYVWWKSANVASLIGPSVQSEITEIEPISEPELMFTFGRLENHGYRKTLPGAEEKFRQWARALKPCKFEMNEVVALSEKPKFIAITRAYWPKSFCVIFSPQSWMIVRNGGLESLRTIRSPNGFSLWLVDDKEFSRLFAREIDVLMRDEDGCLQVLSALRYPDIAKYVMEGRNG